MGSKNWHNRIDEIPVSLNGTGGIKFYRFLEGLPPSIIRIFQFRGEALSRRGGEEGGGRGGGTRRNVVKKTRSQITGPRALCCRVAPEFRVEQIKRNRTRPTFMKHSGFRKGNDPRCIYTIEARFSPHRAAILQPGWEHGDCNASVFRTRPLERIVPILVTRWEEIFHTCLPPPPPRGGIDEFDVLWQSTITQWFEFLIIFIFLVSKLGKWDNNNNTF